MLNGTTHTCVGQEAVAAASMYHRQSSDVVFSNHRCHGHYIACDFPPELLFAEILGRSTGVVGGRGGSQHIAYENFYTNGIQGSYLPICVGIAKGQKYLKNDAITVAFMGDGTWGEGSVYEALNLASLWEVPLLIIVEDNGYAQSTPKQNTLAGTIAHRAAAFGVEHLHTESHNALELLKFFESAFEKVRHNRKPLLLEVTTNRFRAHSKGDDDRPQHFIEKIWREKCPLKALQLDLPEKTRLSIEGEVRSELSNAELSAINAPASSLGTA
jgi:2-oxoisovalerate dehydrogenase E1 component